MTQTTVRFNRGPLKNKYQVVQGTDALEVIVTKYGGTKSLLVEQGSSASPATFVEGTYRRSNVTLKNGAVVFEWMGWKQ